MTDHGCIRCGCDSAPNFIELYDPRDGSHLTHRLCDECQAVVCDAVLNAIQEGW